MSINLKDFRLKSFSPMSGYCTSLLFEGKSKNVSSEMEIMIFEGKIKYLIVEKVNDQTKLLKICLENNEHFEILFEKSDFETLRLLVRALSNS